MRRNWKFAWKRNVSVALFAALIVTVFFDALSYTRSLHGLSVKGFAPAINIVNTHLDPTFSAGYFNYLEILAVNLVLYAIYTFLALTGISLLRQLKVKN